MNELTTPRLTRSAEHRIIAGVCGGIADRMGWNPTVVRVLFVLASVLSAAVPGVLIYVVLWALMPDERKVAARGYATRAGMDLGASTSLPPTHV
jgi:phage shock protein C